MPAETRDLTDTVVAITGGTSGIDEATARQLIEAGARVVLDARNDSTNSSELGDERCAVIAMDTAVPADAERWSTPRSSASVGSIPSSSTPDRQVRRHPRRLR